MTKREIIAEILKIEKIDTESNLMKKNLKELEDILNNLRGKEDGKTDFNPESNNVDIEALKAKLEEEIRQQILSELKAQGEKPNEEVKEKTKPARRVDIDKYELIPVMNITSGKLVYVSNKTGIKYIWSQYGDIEYLEYQELQTMRVAHKSFLNEPFVIILNDDVVNNLGLTKMYENLIDLDDIESIFSLDNKKFIEVIEKSPRGIVHTIVTKAKELYKKNKLESITKINYINERFGTDIGLRASINREEQENI